MLRLLFAILFFALIIIGGVVYHVNNTVSSSLNIEHKQLYTLAQGKSYNHVLSDFKKLGFIDSRFTFRVHAKLNSDLINVKAGTYQLLPNMTMLQVLSLLTIGEEYQFKITFVEGSTFKEWLIQLAETEHIQSTLFDKTTEQILSLLESTYNHPEGLFFPDTYQFTANTKDIDILNLAYQRMTLELTASWQGRAKNLPYKSPYEVLIMASMVEKETAKISEQPLISAVFITRLAKKMRLQTDPTIIYGLGERYTGDITYANLREKTAYNTYRINGMPPTPIAMPGKSAIEASLHPANTPYLYFVSKGNGEHHFSTTLKQHNNAVNKYIRGKK